MADLRRAAIVTLALLLGLAARADDPPVTLDSVDDGQMVDQDSLDDGHTTSLDAADTGHSVDQDAIDTGTTESLSHAERPPEPAPSAPAPLPKIHNTALRGDAQAAREALIKAEARSVKANAEYSEMRAHDFPRGEAAAKIVKEYEEATAAYEQARESYQAILDQVDPASLGD